MITDVDIARLIEELREPAARSFEFQNVPLRDRSEVRPNLWEVAKPLVEAMNSHSEFASGSYKSFLGKQLPLSGLYQAANLLQMALRDGAAEAIARYRRVLATERADIRVVAEVYGLAMTERSHSA